MPAADTGMRPSRSADTKLITQLRDGNELAAYKGREETQGEASVSIQEAVRSGRTENMLNMCNSL
eukprot:7381312-Prymnesium_polylepis.3